MEFGFQHHQESTKKDSKTKTDRKSTSAGVEDHGGQNARQIFQALGSETRLPIRDLTYCSTVNHPILKHWSRESIPAEFECFYQLLAKNFKPTTEECASRCKKDLKMLADRYSEAKPDTKRFSLSREKIKENTSSCKNFLIAIFPEPHGSQCICNYPPDTMAYMHFKFMT